MHMHISTLVSLSARGNGDRLEMVMVTVAKRQRSSNRRNWAILYKNGRTYDSLELPLKFFISSDICKHLLILRFINNEPN